MFCGGIGVWLYDDALGLRVAHAPRLSPPPSKCTQNSPLVADEALCSAVTSSVAVREAGLSQFDRRVLCAALEDLRASCARPGQGGCTYHDLRNAVARHTTRGCSISSVAREATTVLVVTAAPHADIVAELGGASGWRRAAAGNASLEWRWAEPSESFCAATKGGALGHTVFVMRATMPAGAANASFALGVPLARIAAVVARCSGHGFGSNATLRVVASFRANPSLAPTTATYDIFTSGNAVTELKELPGARVAQFKFASALLVPRSEVVAFSSTGRSDVEATAGGHAAVRDTLLLQSTEPGLYEVSVAL